MLGTIRKFSSSIYAKVFLVIVAIPFVFWGMGDVFSGGNKNTIFKIGKKKISTKEFVNYIEINLPSQQNLDSNAIDDFLANFIGEKLLVEEIENFEIKLSENSLSLIIKNLDIFKKEKQFSRVEYEKFLVTNSISAVNFETNVLLNEKKKQMLNLIGGGVVPSNFLINAEFDKINQKRKVQIINLNNLFTKKINISENQIQSYFNENKNTYKKKYKTLKYLKLNPKSLTANDEFSDLFFEKIDQIDDLIVEGKDLSYLIKNYNLGSPKNMVLDKFGKNKNLNFNKSIPVELIENIFNINENEPIRLISHADEYFVFELIKSENIQKEITDTEVKNEIVSILKKNSKRKIIADFISKINKNNFDKIDFDELSKKENLVIEKIMIENQNDNKMLKQELIKQIYSYPENKVILVADINFLENFLVYVDKIENVSLSRESQNIQKYTDISRKKIINSLFNTYDLYLKKKYTIDINYKALESINNYFR